MLRLEDLQSFNCEFEHEEHPCSLTQLLELEIQQNPFMNVYVGILKTQMELLELFIRKSK